MLECYDKEGNPITTQEWGVLHADDDYKRVGLDEIGPYVVSTVWLGLDHGFGSGPPVIFETEVFTATAWHADRSAPDHELLLEIECRRYHSLSEAVSGHEETCLLVRATVDETGPLEAAEGLNEGSEGP